MNKIKDEIQQEILDSIPSNPHGILNLAPRVGKTKLAISLIKRDKAKKVLWVTPSTQLRDKDIPEEFGRWKAKTFLNNTTIICYSSLEKHKGSYDVIILDEYQNITPANSTPLFDGSIKYNRIICLSGSHPKHEEKQEILDNLNLSIISKITIDEAIDKSLIADYNIYIVEVLMNDKDKIIKAGNKEKSWMQTEKESYTYLSKNILKPFFAIKRMRLIYDSPTKEFIAKQLCDNLKGRKLVFCSSIEQAERLGKGNTYHSRRDKTKLDAFLNQEIDELYCVRAGGTGFTYKNIDDLVIIQADSDKKGETTQKLARSLLEQGEEYKGNIWFICLVDTKDKSWLGEALTGFDKTKIKVIKSNELLYGIEQRNSRNTKET